MENLLHNFQLLRPWWLLALIPGVWVWFLLRRDRNRLRPYQGMIAPHLLAHLMTGQGRSRFWHPMTVFPVVGVLLIIALCGPSWRREPSPFGDQEAGLMVLLKASSSMQAQDLAPSRMARAVFKLRDLFALRGAEPSGLIAYSGSAHLVMPLTRDTRIIELMAEGLGPDVMPVDGDRLDAALELARQQFLRAASSGSILVMADGIDTVRAEGLRQFARQNRIPIQVLALGPDAASARRAVAQGADLLNAAVHPVSADDQDVRAIVAGARRRVAAVQGQQEESRPQDGGYLFVPVITILVALWGRRGWSLPSPQVGGSD